MNKFAKIINHQGLVRDLTTQAVLNTDMSLVREHEKRMSNLLKEAERESEIQNMKHEISEMKKLLNKLIVEKVS